MNTINPTASHSILDLTVALDRYAEAGIDPAFDSDMDELERQFAELRLTQVSE